MITLLNTLELLLVTEYFIARKILRKFEQLNVAYIRDEIDGFVKYLNDNFGEGKMAECIEFLLRLKKMS